MQLKDDHSPSRLRNKRLGRQNRNFFRAETEKLIPLFAGMLCSLFFCALIGNLRGVFYKNTVASLPEAVEIAVEVQPSLPEATEEYVNILLAAREEIHDPVLEYYRNPEFKEWVIDFFSGICSNTEIIIAILDNAEKFDVPPALAFALCWEESRFNPNAVNRYNLNQSIDRGLFQLNNRSFPKLELSDFFDIQTNAYYGIAHLRYCLDFGKSEIASLAMYNAGPGRVKTTGAPETTLNYISRILENRRRIESQFHARLIKEEESRLEQARLAEAVKPEETKRGFQLQFSRTLIW